MKGVVLDAASLGEGIDWSPVRTLLDELTTWPNTAPGEVQERIQGYDVVLTNKVVLDAEHLANAEQLKLICVLATGMNNVDLKAADAQSINVRNVQAYGTASVAQHTMSLMLALATRMPQYMRSVAAGEWQKSPMFCLMQHPVMQLKDKHLVLVGHGELGQEVERLAQAFGMQVHVAARPGAKDDNRPSLDALLPIADVISLHCPLTPDTQDLLNAERLATCKNEVLIVNCARGGIVNERDAAHALEQGRIGGLAVDVLSEEPPRNGSPLLDVIHQGLNLIVTPHSAWLAPEARQRIIALSAANIQQFIDNDSA